MSVTIKNADTACSRCGSVALQRSEGTGPWECAGCGAYRWFGATKEQLSVDFPPLASTYVLWRESAAEYLAPAFFEQPECRADEVAYRRNGRIVVIVETVNLTPERIADVHARFGPVEVVSATPRVPVIAEFVRRSAKPRSAIPASASEAGTRANPSLGDEA